MRSFLCRFPRRGGMLPLALLFAAGLLAPAAAADMAGTSGGAMMGDGMMGPAGLGGTQMMPEGSGMLIYNPTIMGMHGNLEGTRDVSPAAIATTTRAVTGGTVRIVPTEMDVQMHMLGGMYAVSDAVNLAVMGSWMRKSMTMTTFAGMMGSRVLGASSDSTEGFGDTTLASLIRLHQDEVHHLHANLGLSLPTGSTTETVRMLNPAGQLMTMRAPYGMQLGSGTVDLLAGLTYTGGADRWSWGAAWRSRIPLDDNGQGYHWGALHEETAWGGYRLWPGVVLTFRAAVSEQDRISGQDAAITGLSTPANPAYYGGDRIDLLGGLSYSAAALGLPQTRLGVEAGAPVYQRLNGPQLSQDWRVAVALSQGF